MDPKSELIRICSKNVWPKPQFHSEMDPNNVKFFLATVVISKPGGATVEYRGEPCSKKVAAEKSAAAKALSLCAWISSATVSLNQDICDDQDTATSTFFATFTEAVLKQASLVQDISLFCSLCVDASVLLSVSSFRTCLGQIRKDGRKSPITAWETMRLLLLRFLARDVETRQRFRVHKVDERFLIEIPEDSNSQLTTIDRSTCNTTEFILSVVSIPPSISMLKGSEEFIRTYGKEMRISIMRAIHNTLLIPDRPFSTSLPLYVPGLGSKGKGRSHSPEPRLFVSVSTHRVENWSNAGTLSRNEAASWLISSTVFGTVVFADVSLFKFFPTTTRGLRDIMRGSLPSGLWKKADTDPFNLFLRLPKRFDPLAWPVDSGGSSKSTLFGRHPQLSVEGCISGRTPLVLLSEIIRRRADLDLIIFVSPPPGPTTGSCDDTATSVTNQITSSYQEEPSPKYYRNEKSARAWWVVGETELGTNYRVELDKSYNPGIVTTESPIPLNPTDKVPNVILQDDPSSSSGGSAICDPSSFTAAITRQVRITLPLDEESLQCASGLSFVCFFILEGGGANGVSSLLSVSDDLRSETAESFCPSDVGNKEQGNTVIVDRTVYESEKVATHAAALSALWAIESAGRRAFSFSGEDEERDYNHIDMYDDNMNYSDNAGVVSAAKVVQYVTFRVQVCVGALAEEREQYQKILEFLAPYYDADIPARHTAWMAEASPSSTIPTSESALQYINRLLYGSHEGYLQSACTGVSMLDERLEQWLTDVSIGESKIFEWSLDDALFPLHSTVRQNILISTSAPDKAPTQFPLSIPLLITLTERTPLSTPARLGSCGGNTKGQAIFNPSLAVQRRRFVCTLLAAASAQTWLDAGCGDGSLLTSVFASSAQSPVPFTSISPAHQTGQLVQNGDNETVLSIDASATASLKKERGERGGYPAIETLRSVCGIDLKPVNVKEAQKSLTALLCGCPQSSCRSTTQNTPDTHSYSIEYSDPNNIEGVSLVCLECGKPQLRRLSLQSGSLLDSEAVRVLAASQPSSIDVVTCIEVIEHLPTIEASIQAAVDILAILSPKIAVFSTPNFEANKYIIEAAAKAATVTAVKTHSSVEKISYNAEGIRNGDSSDGASVSTSTPCLCGILSEQEALMRRAYYRELDHKFEFTRNEFVAWAEAVLARAAAAAAAMGGGGSSIASADEVTSSLMATAPSPAFKCTNPCRTYDVQFVDIGAIMRGIDRSSECGGATQIAIFKLVE